MNHLEACIALNMVPQMGPVRLRRLLDAFGSAEKILLARPDQLAAIPGLSRALAENIARWEDFADPTTELKKAADLGARVITAEDEEYPAALREIHDPPMVLYIRGSLLPRDRQALAVVGSRKASHYALESAKKLGFQTAYAGLTVVSGLARGIDTAAHQGALAAKGRTIAVIGAGRCSPAEAALAEEVGRLIAQAGATLVCGGLGGVMEAACRGARSAGGLTVGILPGLDRAGANPWVELALPTGLGETRNTLVVRAAQAVIAIGGEYGTLSEIGFALRTRTPVFGLGTWQLARHGRLETHFHAALDAAEAVRLALASTAG